MKSYDKIKIGQKAELTHTVKKSDIEKFVELTGDNNKIHTDEISGVNDNSGEFFDRLSVAGQYTKIMKSITGFDTERYSHIFASLTGDGRTCIKKALQECLCAKGTGCGPFTEQSGFVGIIDLLDCLGP